MRPVGHSFVKRQSPIDKAKLVAPLTLLHPPHTLLPVPIARGIDSKAICTNRRVKKKSEELSAVAAVAAAAAAAFENLS